MSLKIDRNRLPAKYALEVYKMVDGYPSTIDLLYELVIILEERKALEEKFTAKSMMREVSVRVNDKDLEESMDDMVAEGWLKRVEDGYQLVKHPWETNDKL
jgi:hypothetical protein